MRTAPGKTKLLPSVLLVMLFSCVPGKDVEFRDISNLGFTISGTPTITGDVLFYNPNRSSMRLKEVRMDILMDGKVVGKVAQDFDLRIAPRSEFTVPVKVALALKDIGIFKSLGNLLNGKGFEFRFTGSIRVKVHGISITVPVDHTELAKPGK